MLPVQDRKYNSPICNVSSFLSSSFVGIVGKTGGISVKTNKIVILKLNLKYILYYSRTKYVLFYVGFF